MSFNYRKEEYALNKRLEKQRRFFKESGMSDSRLPLSKNWNGMNSATDEIRKA